MEGINRARVELEAALATDDGDAIRKAAGELAARCRGVDELEARLLQHARLVDLGLQAASLIHELRQPLAGIKAYAQLVGGAPDNPAGVIQKTGAIVRNAESMEAMCDRLRAYVHGDTVLRVAGNVNDAVRAALEVLSQSLRTPPLEVELLLGVDLPLVAADRTELQQILVNLVRNAHQALRQGPGHIRVRTAAVAGGVEITVTDDGPGVPAEIRERLFQPFVTGRPDGSGLGLYLSRRIAEGIGGTLELDEAGPGATFRLRVPSAVCPG